MKAQGEEQFDLFDRAPKEVWSYSRLKSLRRCALEYKVRWVDRHESLFQPQDIDVRAGRLLHQIIREYYRSEAVSEPHRQLLAIYEKYAPRDPSWAEDSRGETRVLDALRLFSQGPVARLGAAGIEVGCRSDLGGVTFAGQADLVYRSDESCNAFGVLEFKLTDVEVRADDPAERFLQCIIYCLGLPEHFRRFTQVMGVYVFDTGEFDENKVEPHVVQRAIGLIENALSHATGPEFPPTLNPFCSSCGYRALCPAYTRRKSTGS